MTDAEEACGAVSLLFTAPFLKIMKKQISILLLLTIVFSTAGCWVTAPEGTVQVRTVNDRIDKIIRPEDGGVYSWNVFWDDYYPVSLQVKTKEVDITASSKDNAALTLKVSVTYRTINDNAAIESYVRSYGLDEKSRQERLEKVLVGQVQTEGKNAVNEYDAYAILANQEKIQIAIFEKLKPILSTQLFIQIDSVQIVGRPDFLDDRIETASSGVVAAKKKQEEEDALKTAAETKRERLEIEARTFENPKMFRLEELKLQKEIATEWSKHNGTLVFGSNPTLTVPVQ